MYAGPDRRSDDARLAVLEERSVRIERRVDGIDGKMDRLIDQDAQRRGAERAVRSVIATAAGVIGATIAAGVNYLMGAPK